MEFQANLCNRISQQLLSVHNLIFHGIKTNLWNFQLNWSLETVENSEKLLQLFREIIVRYNCNCEVLISEIKTVFSHFFCSFLDKYSISGKTILTVCLYQVHRYDLCIL